MKKNIFTQKKYKITENDSINKKFSFLMSEMEVSKKSKRPFELYIFTWSLIEEILIPELIKFIIKNLKIDAPKSLFKLNQISLNHVYYALSGGDKELFDKLEGARKVRNIYVHKLITSENLIDMDPKLEKELSDLAEVIGLIKSRQTGESIIPSLNRYNQGWNDALQKCQEIINKRLH